MAPFHGMVLLLLGIGYLLHAEPSFGQRDIGRPNVCPFRLFLFFVGRSIDDRPIDLVNVSCQR